MIAEARAAIEASTRIVVMTGAGVSAESGVPTFRGEEGLWRNHRAEDLATPQAFARDPLTVWQWYAWRRSLIAACRPNAAHRSLVQLMCRKAATTLVSQNVDGLHEQAASEAGRSDCRPVLLHGSIFRVRCIECRNEREHREDIEATSLEALPHCPACGSLERPAVVWFGEILPRDNLRRALEAAAAADLCLVVGTSGSVYPAASVVDTAIASGATTIVIDPAGTGFDSGATLKLSGAAAEVLPLLVR